MLGLPKSTEINKQLPKTVITRVLNLTPAEEKKIDSEISKIILVNQVLPPVINVADGKETQSFAVARVIIKNRDFDKNAIIKLFKIVPQNMILILEYEEEEKIAIYHSKLLQTEWMPKESFTVQLKGLNFDDVWENIILQIGDFELQGENTLEEQIAVNEQQEKLKKEIERLEKLARKESQPKKKFELVQKIKKLKEELLDG